VEDDNMTNAYKMNESELNCARQAAEFAATGDYSGKGMLRFWLAIVALGCLPLVVKWIENFW
jgi:hypothetical protein